MKMNKRKAILLAISAIVFIVVIWSLFPLLYLFLISFAGYGALPASLELPKRLTLNNWKEVLFTQDTLWPYMLNSIIVASTTVAITLSITIPAGYSFSRYKSKITNAIFSSFLIFRMMPWIAFSIPIFFMMNKYNLLGTRIGLSLSHLIYTVPFAIWLMKGYFDMVDTQIEEAAIVDGAGRLYILWKITVPLAAPGIAVTVMFSFLFSYIELLYAVLLTRRPTFTLPVRMSAYMATHEIHWRSIACASIISLIPMIVLFAFLQKHFARGITMGAIK